MGVGRERGGTSDRPRASASLVSLYQRPRTLRSVRVIVGARQALHPRRWIDVAGASGPPETAIRLNRVVVEQSSSPAAP